jgi:hypothetical protein
MVAMTRMNHQSPLQRPSERIERRPFKTTRPDVSDSCVSSLSLDYTSMPLTYGARYLTVPEHYHGGSRRARQSCPNRNLSTRHTTQKERHCAANPTQAHNKPSGQRDVSHVILLTNNRPDSSWPSWLTLTDRLRTEGSLSLNVDRSGGDILSKLCDYLAVLRSTRLYQIIPDYTRSACAPLSNWMSHQQ